MVELWVAVVQLHFVWMNILVVSVIHMNILDSVVHKAPADARIVEDQYVHIKDVFNSGP